MSALTINLSDDELRRLADIAAHDGMSLDALASDAVRARLAEEEAWDAQVREGLAEADSGALIDYETFRTEMSALLAKLGRPQ